MNPTAYFSEVLKIRALQKQIVSETRRALEHDAGRMAEALGVPINVEAATTDVTPGLLTRARVRHAWVGASLPLDESWVFYLGSYFEVSETAPDQNDLYVYGAVGLPDTHDPDALRRAITVLPPWVIESNETGGLVEMFPDNPLGDLGEYSLHLGGVIGEWCRIWSSLGGLGGMARKGASSE